MKPFTELEDIFAEELASIQDGLRPSDVLVITPHGMTLLSEGTPNPMVAPTHGVASWLAFRYWPKRRGGH